MAVREVVDRYLSEGRTALRFAPLELAYSLALALLFSVAVVAEDDDVWEFVGRMALGGTIALPLVLALSLLGAAGRLAAATRAIAQTAILGVGLGWAWVVFDPDLESTLWQATFMTAASILALIAVPSALVDDPADRAMQFWSTNLRLVTRATVVSVFAQILFAGFAGVLASINVLFEMDIGEKPYGLLFAVIGLGLSPFLLAGGIPSFVQRPRADDAAPPAAGWLTAYLFGPLFLAYLAVVYAYHMKALVTWELPKNLLSPLILVAAAFAIAGAAMSVPLKPGTTGSGVARIMRMWPALVLPLLPLAFYAVWVRIGEYGFTEMRYVRLMLVVAVAIAGLTNLAARVLRRGTPWATTALVFAATAVVSAAPIVGASAISVRSQSARISEIVAAIGVDAAAGWPATAIVVGSQSEVRADGHVYLIASQEQVQSLSSSLSYVCQHAGFERAATLVGLPEADENIGCWGLDSTLGLQSGGYMPTDDAGRTTHYFSAEERPARGLMAGDMFTVYVNSYNEEASRSEVSADVPVAFGIEADGSTFLILSEAGGRWSASLAEYGQQLANVAPRWELLPSTVPNVFTFESAAGPAQLIVRSAEFLTEVGDDGPVFVRFVTLRGDVIVPSR